MSNDRQVETSGDDRLEALLRRAEPRPKPSQTDAAQVREVVRAEWQQVVKRRGTRQQVTRFAIAASVVLAAFLVFNTFRSSDPVDVRIADIEQSFGSIFLLGDRSELRETNHLPEIRSGQTIVTGAGSGMGLELVGGSSVRVDERTRIEFVRETELFLHSGRVYVDSRPSGAIGYTNDRLEIRTPHGVVRHVGTQFIAAVVDAGLSVSVREGSVGIEGRYHDATVQTGQQVKLLGRQRPTVLNVAPFGEHWSWTEAMAPGRDFDGRRVLELLEWVSRETGLQLRFESAGAEELARKELLKGEIDAPPTNALRLWMMSVDLDWRIDDGVIYVSETDH